ncbi:hypothetical protein NIES2109_10470 [Nostoc sp. HK-01]|uniref:Uncharacterized protein n=1 Tax=Anabaenopsis circularis NIES-21 TaxID=1085406 RepID=A0A1Z4GJD9_9CYAN|nr:hypothetical protein NIES21_34710 [Anabaenopsis circularis NIES-21]BBD58274.1 hypothetical protein NIES2109_10470 [Nostoc sp. HK-01]
MPIDLKQFRENLTYRAQAPVAQIISDLQEIAEIDRLAELKQKEYGKKALYYFLGIVIAIGLIIVVSITLTNTQLLGGLALLLIVAILGLAIAFIVALITRAKFGRINVINYRYQAAQKILQMLSRDMDANTNVKLNLSFQPIHKNEYKTTTTPHPHKSGWKIDNYQHEWISIQGSFLDKTRFELSATSLSKKQYGWKRGSSGKSKYKSKIKSGGLDIHLNLTYSQRRYGAIKILQSEIDGALKLPKLSNLRNLRLTDKSMQLAVRIAPNVADNQAEIYQTVTAMFLSLYHVLNLAKSLSK